MPTFESFLYTYDLGPGGDFYFFDIGPNTLTDSEDGGSDGSTALGESIQISGDAFPTSVVTYLGTTPEGAIVVTNGFVTLALSNTPGLTGATSITPGGPYLYCFAQGTRIATSAADIAVEDLKPGDLIQTKDGGDVAVKWVGIQTVATRFCPAERLRPVCFATGALGGGLPHSDLTVTADHAMLVDGILCHASALVNTTTITRVPLSEMGSRFTVYHIETENHEIILANGAPTETFIDNVSRRVFDNFAEYEALYGDAAEMIELPLPRAMSARQVPNSIRGKLGLADAA